MIPPACTYAPMPSYSLLAKTSCLTRPLGYILIPDVPLTPPLHFHGQIRRVPPSLLSEFSLQPPGFGQCMLSSNNRAASFDPHVKEHLVNLPHAWCDTLVQWDLNVKCTLGNTDVPTAFPERSLLPLGGLGSSQGGHDKKVNGDLEPADRGLGGGRLQFRPLLLGVQEILLGRVSKGGPDRICNHSKTTSTTVRAPLMMVVTAGATKFRIPQMVPVIGRLTVVRCLTLA